MASYIYHYEGPIPLAFVGTTGLGPGPIEGVIPLDEVGYGGTMGLWAVIEPVPEPSSMILVGSGLAGLVAYRKRFKKV